MKQFSIIIFILLIIIGGNAVFAEESADKKDDLEYHSVEERRLYFALQQERENLSLERKRLNEKKKELKRIEIEVDKKIDQLKALRQQIEALIAVKDKKEARKIKELSKMYEKMTAIKAARIIGSLNQKLAISLLENMKNKSAAKILDSMERDKAARLTDAFSNLDIK